MEELLPAGLTIDILSRLLVNTIIHCKCVCKKWRNLVTDSSFADLHLSISPTALIIHHRPTTIDDPGILEWVEIQDNDDYRHLYYDPLMRLCLNLTPIFQNSQINLKGSVNGLICLLQSYPKLNNIYISNPVTREYMILPTQKYRRTSYPRIGFGVSSTTGEYKVIQTFRRHKSDILEAEVYTLGTGQWRSLGRVPYAFYGSDGPFLNDHCHWIVYDEKDAPEKLCSFDLDKKTFQLFPSPPPLEEAIRGSEYHSECLTILKGCLCIMDSWEPLFTIWVMKEYGIKESWHKEVVSNQAICPHLDWLLFAPSYMIEVLKDGSILTLREGKLWAFYPKNLTVEDTGLFQFSSFSSGLAYRPNFLKLQRFELERVNMF